MKKQKRITKVIFRILYYFSWFFFGFLFLIFAYFTADKITNYNLPLAGYRVSVIVSPSMSELHSNNTYFDEHDLDVGRIQVNDLIVTKTYKSEDDVQKWDVVTYLDQNNLMICHRVIDIYESDGTKYFVTKGDANSVNDNPFSFEAIKGKVIKVIPDIGIVVSYAQSGYVWLGFCGAGFSICLSYLLTDYLSNKSRKYLKGKHENKDKIIYFIYNKLVCWEYNQSKIESQIIKNKLAKSSEEISKIIDEQNPKFLKLSNSILLDKDCLISINKDNKFETLANIKDSQILKEIKHINKLEISENYQDLLRYLSIFYLNSISLEKDPYDEFEEILKTDIKAKKVSKKKNSETVDKAINNKKGKTKNESKK